MLYFPVFSATQQVIEMASDYQRWVCDACGYIYEEEKGDPDSGLAPGTRYDDIPDDWMCPLCGLNKSDLRLLPEQAQTISRPTTAIKKAGTGKSRGSADHIVIVGAGIAAWSVAEEIRKTDQTSQVLIVTACEGASYPKPALSTALASGKAADDLIDLDAITKASELGIDIRTETRVIKIDTDKKRLTTAKGGIQYGKLVLALGAHQRELSVSGNASDNILRVNDLAAYRKMRARLQDHVEHVTILGAGLIGCEFAEDLSSAGFQVSVIDPAQYPLASLLPVETAKRLERQLQAKGIDWRFNKTLDAVDSGGNKLRATLSDGMAIETDMVISAAGLVANIQLAEKAGLSVNRGISVDRQLCTTHKDIYAIGDCAEVEGHIYAYIEPIRRQAQTVAAHLKGEDLPFEIKSPLVRIKTPSFPLTVCPPDLKEGNGIIPRESENQERIDYLDGDEIVGFVLSGEQSKSGASLYRELFA